MKISVSVLVVVKYGACGDVLYIHVANFSPRLRASILVVENWKLVRFTTISGRPVCFHLLSSTRRESWFDRLWGLLWLKFFLSSGGCFGRFCSWNCGVWVVRWTVDWLREIVLWFRGLEGFWMLLIILVCDVEKRDASVLIRGQNPRG